MNEPCVMQDPDTDVFETPGNIRLVRFGIEVPSR